MKRVWMFADAAEVAVCAACVVLCFTAAGHLDLVVFAVGIAVITGYRVRQLRRDADRLRGRLDSLGWRVEVADAAFEQFEGRAESHRRRIAALEATVVKCQRLPNSTAVNLSVFDSDSAYAKFMKCGKLGPAGGEAD